MSQRKKDFYGSRYLWFAVVASVIQFAFFKYSYPYAGYINDDSYAYLRSAFANSSIATYPIGYSKYLRLFSVFSTDDTVFVGCQYLLLQASLLYLLLTIYSLYKPQKILMGILFCLLLLNPISLYVSNYISSDCLFLCLTLTWFALLLRMIDNPTIRFILLQAVILSIAFTIRYNALFYPLVSGVAFLLAKTRLWVKFYGTFLGIAFIGVFFIATGNKYYALTGEWQFSPFSGWQMANNALCAYRFVRHPKPVPVRFRRLDSVTRSFFNSTDIARQTKKMSEITSFYMWAANSPLRIYLSGQFKKALPSESFSHWAAMGLLYSAYGSYLIRQYPREYVLHYLVPNGLSYFAPPVEFLGSYSSGSDKIEEVAKTWFNYRSDKVWTRTGDFNISILNAYPVLAGAMNVIFPICTISFMLLQGYKKARNVAKGLYFFSSFWLLNFAFSVTASPVVLRYELSALFLLVPFSCLAIAFIIKEAWVCRPVPTKIFSAAQAIDAS